eukprot:NODE_83_length_22684_cov_0.307934.p17 type:complete len:116 gc:universal NODE_83_length_22684_cov_0.307934:8715-8368(-)
MLIQVLLLSVISGISTESLESLMTQDLQMELLKCAKQLNFGNCEAVKHLPNESKRLFTEFADVIESGSVVRFEFDLTDVLAQIKHDIMSLVQGNFEISSILDSVDPPFRGNPRVI